MSVPEGESGHDGVAPLLPFLTADIRRLDVSLKGSKL
jgi:hypothetical protein